MLHPDGVPVQRAQRSLKTQQHVRLELFGARSRVQVRPEARALVVLAEGLFGEEREYRALPLTETRRSEGRHWCTYAGQLGKECGYRTFPISTERHLSKLDSDNRLEGPIG